MKHFQFETAHFTFRGLFASREAAVEAFTSALPAHAQEYSGADIREMERTMADEVQEQELVPGFVYRSGGAGDERILAENVETLLDLLKLQQDRGQADRYYEIRHRYVQSAARRFAQILGEWFTPEQRREVVRRNVTEAYENCCASHDFCDANEAMAEALTGMGLNPLPDGYAGDDGEGMPETVRTIWNAAWDVAKRAGFWWDEARATLPGKDLAEAAAHAAVRDLANRLGIDPEGDLGGMAEYALDGGGWDGLVDAMRAAAEALDQHRDMV